MQTAEIIYMDKRILRLPEVKARTGLGKTSIYAGMKDNTFPKQVKLGKRASGWYEHEIQAWIEARDKREAANQDQHQAAA